jgi:hypothetical protein
MLHGTEYLDVAEAALQLVLDAPRKAGSVLAAVADKDAGHLQHYPLTGYCGDHSRQGFMALL